MSSNYIFFLGWCCLFIWILTDFSSLPPVLNAYERGKFIKGENPYPWVQSFVASAARATYIYHADSNFPIDLGLGTLISLGCCSFTGIVAVGLSKKKKQCRRLSLLMWLGIMICAFISWICNRQVAGIYLVVVLALTRGTFWLKIPYALKSRDGRY